MFLPSRCVQRLAFGVRRSAFAARRDWWGARLRPVVQTPRGYVGQAALALAQGPGTLSPARGRPRYRVKPAAPANGPARPIHFAPRDKPGVSAVRRSRRLNKIRGHIRAEKNNAMSGESGLKWLRSSRPERCRTPNAEHQTPNAKRFS
jgi:hypothetical protein